MGKIELENVSKVFDDDVVAVDDMSLVIEDAELVVFVGPSGSGKSTALRLIAGLEKPTSGEIYINDVPVTYVEPQDRNVSMVFQSFALYPHRTVHGNISFPLEARGLPKDEVEEKVREAAAVLEITELLDRKPAQLSGGQQQRVALGRAIVRDPEVFLMDEPLANLDERLRKVMQAEMVRLQRSLDTTMVHVTHNQEEAMTMGDRIVVMNRGTIQQVAPGREAYLKPRNRFVAEFIGTPRMNIIEGTVDGSTFVASRPDVTLRIPEHLGDGASADELTLGIRPEHTQVVDSPDEYTLTGTVEVIELMGDEQVIHVDVDGTEILSKLSAAVPIEETQTIHVRLVPERIHLFDGTEPEADRIVRRDEAITAEKRGSG